MLIFVLLFNAPQCASYPQVACVPTLPYHVAEGRRPRRGRTMGNARRKQVRGRWAGWAASTPCRPGTRAMELREAADGGQVAGRLGVPEVRVRDVLARREPQPHLAAREVLPPPLGDGRDGHAAPRGVPAPLVPRHVAAGEVEEGCVGPRARRPGIRLIMSSPLRSCQQYSSYLAGYFSFFACSGGTIRYSLKVPASGCMYVRLEI